MGLEIDAGLEVLWNPFFSKLGCPEDPNMEVFGCQGGDYERTMPATREELRTPIFLIYLKEF